MRGLSGSVFRSVAPVYKYAKILYKNLLTMICYILRFSESRYRKLIPCTMNINHAFRPKNYTNPDNDPRGSYVLADATTRSFDDRPAMRYEWRGQLPPEGRSWRFSKEKAKQLEQEGRIVFSESGRPQIKRYLQESREAMHSLLRRLPNEKFDREIEFTRAVVPSLARILDYAEDETFYEYGREVGTNRYRADVVMSSSIESAPWVVLEIKGRHAHSTRDWISQVRRYLKAFGCRTGVVVSPETLILVSDEDEKYFDLRALSSAHAEEIVCALERNAQSPSTREEPLGRRELVDLIECVETSRTNDEKGKSLEALARFLFNSVPQLRCKYSNLQTRSSEIDLVVEYDRSKGIISLFDELGRYCLVECKNWSKPVGVNPVRDFMGKLDKCRIKLGVIFSKNGVTGVDSGAEAIREIQSRFDRDGTFLLVFSLEDIKLISDGNAFIEAIDLKADNLRFDR